MHCLNCRASTRRTRQWCTWALPDKAEGVPIQNSFIPGLYCFVCQLSPSRELQSCSQFPGSRSSRLPTFGNVSKRRILKHMMLLMNKTFLMIYLPSRRTIIQCLHPSRRTLVLAYISNRDPPCCCSDCILFCCECVIEWLNV